MWNDADRAGDSTNPQDDDNRMGRARVECLLGPTVICHAFPELIVRPIRGCRLITTASGVIPRHFVTNILISRPCWYWHGPCCWLSIRRMTGDFVMTTLIGTAVFLAVMVLLLGLVAVLSRANSDV